MSKFIILLAIQLSSVAFAGWDKASTLKCRKPQLELTIKRAGSLFGRDWITLKKSGVVILDESYEQDWQPNGESLVEKTAKKELPCSNNGFYQMLKSKNAISIQSYTNGTFCENKGERDTTYVQLLSSNEIIKFDNKNDCR